MDGFSDDRIHFSDGAMSADDRDGDNKTKRPEGSAEGLGAEEIDYFEAEMSGDDEEDGDKKTKRPAPPALRREGEGGGVGQGKADPLNGIGAAAAESPGRQAPLRLVQQTENEEATEGGGGGGQVKGDAAESPGEQPPSSRGNTSPALRVEAQKESPPGGDGGTKETEAEISEPTPPNPPASDFTIYYPHEVLGRTCLEKIQDVQEKWSPSIGRLVKVWQTHQDYASIAMQNFTIEMAKLNGEIKELEARTRESLSSEAEDADSDPRISPEEELDIMTGATNHVLDGMKKDRDSFRDRVKQLQADVQISEGNIRADASSIEDHGQKNKDLIDAQKNLRNLESHIHSAIALQVERDRNDRMIQLKAEMRKNKENKEDAHTQLYKVHNNIKRAFQASIQKTYDRLENDLKEAQNHFKTVKLLESKYQDAQQKLDQVGIDLCRVSELLVVPESTEGHYDSIIARIMQKHGRISEPPEFDGDWESECNKKEKTPNLYQILPAYFASSDNGDNFLVYHDMGTGKTCTIALMVLQMAMQQYNALPMEPVQKQESSVGCLVLAQKDSAVSKFTAELRDCGLKLLNDFQKKTGVWCKIDGAVKGPRDDEISSPNPSDRTHHRRQWRFYKTKPEEKKTSPFFVASFQTITHDYHHPPGVGVIKTSGGSEKGLPAYVIVDEAHNLYDPAGLGADGFGKKRVHEYAAELERQFNIPNTERSKVIFLTGTPTTGTLSNLLRLLRLLGPSVREVLKNTEGEEKLLHEYFQKTPLKTKQSFRPYTWRHGLKEKIGKALKGKISYVSMANDPRVFAQFGIYLNVPTAKGKILLVPKRKNVHVENSASGAIIIQNEAKDAFEIDKDSLQSGTKYVLVKTRPQKSHQFKTATELGKHRIFRKYASDDAHFPAWEAVFSLVQSNETDSLDEGPTTYLKHFFYYDNDARGDIKDFEDAFIKKFYKNNIDDGKSYLIPSFSDIIKDAKNLDDDDDCSEKTEKIIIESIKAFQEKENYGQKGIAVYLRRQKAQNGQSEKAVAKINLNLITRFECVYNSVANKDGTLIRYVFVSREFKEGLSLFGTRFVHVLSPPQTERALQQAVRRALRYCGMKYVGDRKKWFVTVLLYCANYEAFDQISQQRMQALTQAEQYHVMNGQRCEKISKMRIMPGSDPVDNFLELLKEYAVDCNALSPVNKVRCAEKPSAAETPGCGQLWKYEDESEWSSKKARGDCSNDLKLRSLADEKNLSLHDEILRALLNTSKINNAAWKDERIAPPKNTAGFILDADEAPLMLFESLMKKEADGNTGHQLANAVRIFLNKRYAESKMTQEKNQYSQKAKRVAEAYFQFKRMESSIESERSHERNHILLPYPDVDVVNHRADAKTKKLIPR